VKHWTLVFITAMAFNICNAQPDTVPPYKKNPGLPPIQLVQADNSVLTRDALKKNKETMIMYFSPDCDHCKHQMEAMIKNIEQLKKYQIVMATHRSLEEMKGFYKKYELSKYANIKMGQDSKYLLPPYYRMGSLPYMALYDAKGNLISVFEGNIAIDKLVAAFDQRAKGKL
jgi:thioredoxin-related protein